MGPAVVLGGLVVLSVVVLGVTLGTSPRGSRMDLPALRRALPWVLAGTVAVGVALLFVLPDVPWLVPLGLMAYAAVAIAAVWRLVTLDRASNWMTPSQRLARIAISSVALTWLGVVLGLLLLIAAYVLEGPYDL